ncbi:MAG: DinB family protein [Acidimicrobiales bacterium]
MTVDTYSRLDRLTVSYVAAKVHSLRLTEDLTQHQLDWRPVEDSSAIGWHLGHQASVNHFMVRNLTAAEPSIDPGFDRLFDSATPERERGVLPPLVEIVDYRSAVEESTRRVLGLIAAGDVGAPAQLRIVAEGLLIALINHEYQHSEWIGEVRHELAGSAAPAPTDDTLSRVDGYWVLSAQ